MECMRCKKNIAPSHYCPHCGMHQTHESKQPQRPPQINVNDLFNQMFRQMEQLMGGGKLDDFMEGSDKKQRKAGFTINIVQGGDEQPQVQIQPMGEEQAPVQQKPLPKKFAQERETEEPQTVVRHVGNMVIADLDVPGVHNLDDVAVTELGQSAEIRAIAGKKAFFKIIKKPSSLRLTDQKLKGDKLHLEFS